MSDLSKYSEDYLVNNLLDSDWRNVTFHNIFKVILDTGFWTPANMGENLGVTANTVYRYIKGTVYPSSEVVQKIAEMGNLNADHLLGLVAREKSAKLQKRKGLNESEFPKSVTGTEMKTPPDLAANSFLRDGLDEETRKLFEWFNVEFPRINPPQFLNVAIEYYIADLRKFGFNQNTWFPKAPHLEQEALGQPIAAEPKSMYGVRVLKNLETVRVHLDQSGLGLYPNWYEGDLQIFQEDYEYGPGEIWVCRLKQNTFFKAVGRARDVAIITFYEGWDKRLERRRLEHQKQPKKKPAPIIILPKREKKAWDKSGPNVAY